MAYMECLGTNRNCDLSSLRSPGVQRSGLPCELSGPGEHESVDAR